MGNLIVNPEFVNAIADRMGHIDTANTITNLDDIPLNSQGRVTLDASVSPSGTQFVANYECYGSSGYRTLIVSSTYSTTVFINTRNNSTTWKGWRQFALNSEVVHYKSVTIEKATAGTSWSQTSRNIGTVSDLFGVADSKLVNAMVYDAGFNPAANATVGTFNGNVFVAATQTTTLSSDIKVRVAYID